MLTLGRFCRLQHADLGWRTPSKSTMLWEWELRRLAERDANDVDRVLPVPTASEMARASYRSCSQRTIMGRQVTAMHALRNDGKRLRFCNSIGPGSLTPHPRTSAPHHPRLGSFWQAQFAITALLDRGMPSSSTERALTYKLVCYSTGKQCPCPCRALVPFPGAEGGWSRRVWLVQQCSLAPLAIAQVV